MLTICFYCELSMSLIEFFARTKCLRATAPDVKTLYANSQEAEAAFYDAFSKGNLDAMMAVWADDEDIYCVHPGAARVSGIEQVRESWRRIFASGQTLRFQLRSRRTIHGMMI